jgi:guanylate kinase
MNYKNADKIIEMRKYDTIKGVWYYCTLDDGRMDLNSANYIIIGTLEGYRALKKYYKNAVVPLYIEVDDGERLSRAIARERGQKKPDYSELCRRFLADCEDFSDEKLKEAGITLHFKNEVIEDCADEIKKYILSLSS